MRPIGTGCCLRYGPPATAAERDLLPRNTSASEKNAHIPAEYGPVGYSFLELITAIVATQGNFSGATAQDTLPKDQPFAFAPGCFRDSIRAVNRGTHSVDLRIMHASKHTIGSTREGTIAFVDFQHALHVRILPSKTGRYVREVLARLPGLRELSVGYRVLGWDVVETPFGPVTMVSNATLLELSVVDDGGMPHTSLTLFKEPKVMPAHVYLKRMTEREKSLVLASA